MARCSKKITGSLPRSAERMSPTASSAFEGTATCQPTPCTQATSFVWLCQGSPHLKNPPGMRTTTGAAKRLRVRQRSVPQSFSCSAAQSAYLRNWISATGSNPASAMPTARPTMPSSERLVSNTRGAPYLSCSPRVAPCTPPLGPTSSPKTSMRGLSACALLGQDLGGLVGLGVLPGVSGQARHREAQHEWRAPFAHPFHRAAGELGGRSGIGAVALEDREARERAQVRGNVAARGLQTRGHGNPEAVVLDGGEQRELERRREVVAARRELIEHLALGQEAALLDVIERSRGMEERGDAAPVDVAGHGVCGRRPGALGARNRGWVCGHGLGLVRR